MFVLRTSNFCGATISRYSSSTETLYCLNRNTVHVFYFLIILLLTQIIPLISRMRTQNAHLLIGYTLTRERAVRQFDWRLNVPYHELYALCKIQIL